ncbi:MAG: alpha/beta hydrolase fold protein [Thermoleophilia bacterium]|nr:alpha/beta hydrolase fold protein [Thermoleophilia bacterium]
MRPRFTAQHRGGSGTPLVLLHGFTDTWRTWDLVRPQLERDHDVLAPTLLGHAGGPEVTGYSSDTLLADGVERAMDAAGFETAHIVGNSLGGYVAMHLAERGRARSVTAFAPAGGWPDGDASFAHARRVFERMQRELVVGAPLARVLTKTRAGRRYATREIVTTSDHIPRELLMHIVRGARACTIAQLLLSMSDELTWAVDGDRIDCPVRIVWGTADRVLLHPVAGDSYRTWLPNAEWIELDGVGHCPQLDAPEDVLRLVREQVASAERV